MESFGNVTDIMDELFKIPKSIGKRATCVSCGLYKKAHTPKMQVQGKGKKRILLVGQSPTMLDDDRGMFWQDKAGRMLRRVLSDNNIDVDKDCFSINAVNCRTVNKKGDDAAPAKLVIDACRKSIKRTIEEIKPHVIIALGDSAIYSLLGDRLQKEVGTIHKWRGWQIPDRLYNAWICPVFHPSYVKYPEVKTIWKQDLRKALKYVKRAMPIQQDEEDSVHMLDGEKEIKKLLRHLLTVTWFAFDIESTGIKPHDKKKHKIAMTSFAYNDKESFVIPGELSKGNMRLLKKVMENPNVGKVAHNMKFEHAWYFNIYGIEIKDWMWDSMQAAHVLNNQTGISGLKFQAIVHFGIFDYDSEVAPYLRPLAKDGKKDKSGNAVNQIQKVLDDPILRRKMSIYCGVDSLLTYKLAVIQAVQIGKDEGLQKAYKLIHDGILVLFTAEQQGMRIDIPYIEKETKRLTKRIELLENKLLQTKLIRHWQRIYKDKFNLTSNYQLGYLLYTIKKLKPPKQTEKGAGSTDEESLRLLQIPELDILLQMRKYLKIRDTYFAGFLREEVDGFVHPSFNLHLAVTYRGSANMPNFQNIPKRDKESMRLVRRSIYPRKGNRLMEIDFSKLEVSIAACYHKDPRMLRYLTSDKNDMHGDLAEQIFKVNGFDRHISEHNYLRDATKNGFIFPQFYGDYYVGNAETLRQWTKLSKGRWRENEGVDMPGNKTIGSHLISQGIKSFDKFLTHLKSIEYDFWNNRFRVYKKWKDTWVAKYQKQGDITMLTGFKCVGVMRKNEVINYPVQGAAFHCLLWCLIRVDALIRERGLETRIIGQIHDALVLDVVPSEVKQVYKLVVHVATKELPKEWSWIIAPLAVDAEICDIDKPWAEKKEFTLL